MNYTQKDYYTEIEKEEYHDFYNNKRIDFNKHDLNRLISLNDKFEVYKWNNTDYIDFNNQLFIHECEDEWFLVYNDGNFYKCDQIDGLIYFLKDKDFI